MTRIVCVTYYLCGYLDATEYLRNSGKTYTEHMARPRGDLTVAELLQYRVDQVFLQEENSHASWLTCWWHHEVRAELRGRDLIREEFPPRDNALYEEDEDDFSLRRWQWTPGGGS